VFTNETNVIEGGPSPVVRAVDNPDRANRWFGELKLVWQMAFGLAVAAIRPAAVHAQVMIPDTNFFALTTVAPSDPSVRAASAPDGKILVRGGFEAIRGTLRSGLARINSDSTLDTSFVPAQTGVPTVQADGKVLLNQNYALTRLNLDGSLDSSFVLSTVGIPIYSVVPQSDGKIYLSGPFSELKGVKSQSIARLNSDGSIDRAFMPELGLDEIVYLLAVQSDRKIVVSRWFSLPPSAPVSPLLRLNEDGSLDRSFGIKTVFTGNIYAVAVRSNGRILVGGAFTDFNGVGRSGIVELNPDGTIASDSNTGSGTGTVMSVLPLANGKTLIGGSFYEVNGSSRSRLARLNEDGSLDDRFNVEVGGQKFAPEVHQILPTSGGLLSLAPLPRSRALRVSVWHASTKTEPWTTSLIRIPG